MPEETSSVRVVAGRYRLDEELEPSVFRATDLDKQRAVVVTLLESLGGSRRERVIREIKRASQVRHPGLVEVLDVDRTHEGEPFVVTELVTGERLADRLAKGKLEPTAAAGIATRVCAALAAAHDAGVVHRDLRPSVVTVLPNGLEVKVHGLGFPHTPGAADVVDPYASPEHRRGEPVGRRADVYSIGAMLHAMLVGEPPSGGTNAIDAKSEERTITAKLRAVVDRCIAEDPKERFVDTGELEDALMASVPPGSIPPSKPPSRPAPQLKSEPPSEAAIPPSSRAPRLETPRPPRAESVPPVRIDVGVKKEAPLSPRPPAAPPPRPLGRPLTERPKWEDALLDLRDGPLPRVVIAVVLGFALTRIVTSGWIPWLVALVAAGAAYAVWWKTRRRGT